MLRTGGGGEVPGPRGSKGRRITMKTAILGLALMTLLTPLVAADDPTDEAALPCPAMVDPQVCATVADLLASDTRYWVDFRSGGTNVMWYCNYNSVINDSQMIYGDEHWIVVGYTDDQGMDHDVLPVPYYTNVWATDRFGNAC